MAAPQYTTCVQPEDYEAPNFTAEIIVAAAGLVLALFTFGISLVATLAAGMSALQKVCDYMLHGKLVCLGGDQCAIGRITAFETVDDKSGFDRIDNDFSINLLLAPHDLAEFAHGTPEQNYQKVVGDTSAGPGRQGWLIAERPNMPQPREAKGGARYSPLFTVFPDSNTLTYNPFLGLRGTPYAVPVLHCEIEGERAHAVCATLAALASPIPGLGALCRIKLFGIPLGRWACALVAAALAPLVLIALGIAWAAGANDNRAFQGAGSLERGDCVVVTGRWVYDAGHDGYNELHPVKSIQKIPEGRVCDRGGFRELHGRWCARVGEVPPEGATGTPLTLTPPQRTVFDNQRRPEHRWSLHPLLDGCAPADEPGAPPVIR